MNAKQRFSEVCEHRNPDRFPIDYQAKREMDRRLKKYFGVNTEMELLDALGDLALLGHPIIGRLEVSRGSHELHQSFVQHLIHQEDAWRLWVPSLHNREHRRTAMPAALWQGAPA